MTVASKDTPLWVQASNAEVRASNELFIIVPMKVNKLIIALPLFCFLGIMPVYCQLRNINFNDMPFFNNMYINPAFTANSDTSNHKELKVFANNKVDQPMFNFYTLTFECPLKKIKSGAGILINYNNYYYQETDWGFNNKTNLFTSKLFYQYNPFKNIYAGFSLGLINYIYNVTYPPYPPAAYIAHSIKADMDAGLLYKSRTFFAGVCVKNLNSPDFLLKTSPTFGGRTYKYYIPCYERTFNLIAGHTFNFKKHSLECTALYSSFALTNSLAYNNKRFSINSVFNINNKLFCGLLINFNNSYTRYYYGLTIPQLSVILGGKIYHKIKFYLGYSFYYPEWPSSNFVNGFYISHPRASHYSFSDPTVQNIQSMAAYVF